MGLTLSALAGIAPVLAFLAGLLLLDSYKLVPLHTVVAMLFAGAAACAVSYAVNGGVLQASGLDRQAFSRYVAPLTEELLKATVIAFMVHRHRVGFLVDAAVLGFAVGAGFAATENLLYLRALDGGFGAWLVRGFGTAIMHGGATAIFAVMAMALLERRAGRHSLPALLPGFAIAVVLHSAYNHFFLSPFASTVGIAVAFPVAMAVVYARSEAALGRWLGRGFDADAQMLELIGSGRLSDAPIGRYLGELQARFEGPVLADLLCYLRLHTELALRAKGVLMMRESGFEAGVDEATREKFAELRYLERNIGPTGLLAIHPLLNISRRDLWQLYMLEKRQ